MPEVDATVAPGRGRVGPFTLSVSSEMVFLDLPVVERVRRLTALDVQVEIWDWTRHDIDALERLRESTSSLRTCDSWQRIASIFFSIDVVTSAKHSPTQRACAFISGLDR